MNTKITILVYVFFIALSAAACGTKDGSSAAQQESGMQSGEIIEWEIKGDEMAQGSSTQTVENTDLEMTSEELLDSFINGSIGAMDATDTTSVFYITDLSMNAEERDAYSIGERVDLDNDGENELIICGPYGEIYLDARDNKVYEFAAGDGSAVMLSYVVYNGATWILYSNCMNAGYEAYHMEKFEGADHFAAGMDFSAETVDENNTESGMKYTLNGTEISYDEYTALCSRIFAAEVNTN